MDGHQLIEPHFRFKVLDLFFQALFLGFAERRFRQLLSQTGQHHFLAVIIAGVWFHSLYLARLLAKANSGKAGALRRSNRNIFT